MKKNGFTLIELLAVIVILAIIALIAVPIVLGIIEDARKSATLRSAEHYLNGVEQAVARAMLNGVAIDSDKQYPIMESGDICLGTYTKKTETEPESCKNIDGEDATLKVEVDGQKPSNGSVTLSSGSISTAILTLNSKPIELVDGKLAYKESNSNQIITYQFGEQVKFNPGDGERTWYIIDSDDTTVTLILDRNLGEVVEWVKQSDFNDDTTWSGNESVKGPITALKTLNTLTTNWGNVDPISNYINENRIGFGEKTENTYQKLEITNGTSVLTHEDGGTTTIDGVTRARMLSYEDFYKLLTPNLREENLEAYLERNMDTLKTTVSTQITDTDALSELEAVSTVDELIEFGVSYMGLSGELPRYWQLYHMVYGSIESMEIETTYSIEMAVPEFVLKNLNEYQTTPPYAYWLLTGAGYGGAYKVIYDGKIKSDGYVVSHGASFGIRPVITIPKSKLS